MQSLGFCFYFGVHVKYFFLQEGAKYEEQAGSERLSISYFFHILANLHLFPNTSCFFSPPSTHDALAFGPLPFFGLQLGLLCFHTSNEPHLEVNRIC